MTIVKSKVVQIMEFHIAKLGNSSILNHMRVSLKIAIIGAPGNQGNTIIEEALSRGYGVKVGDIDHPHLLGLMLKEQDLVVSRAPDTDHDRDVLMKAVRLSGVKRYIVSAGAAMPAETRSRSERNTEENEKTAVSYQDFAIALLDEIEASCHPKDHSII
jgi:putative NADH-flavin reductase